MYYRVAIQVASSPTWKWKSSALSSLNILFQWFQYYQAVPHDRLCIFSSCSQEDLDEQLVRENQGLVSTSVPATQFLQERRIAPPRVVREAEAGGTRANEPTASITILSEPSPDESRRSPLDKRREELEGGAGGDHDLPYSFALPAWMPQVLAWVRLLAKVQRGELQP